jgi:hypothetical protein
MNKECCCWSFDHPPCPVHQEVIDGLNAKEVNKQVWLAHVTTDSLDHYYFLFNTKPTLKSVIHKVWEKEQAADLDWYEATTSVYICELEIE